LLTVTVSRPGSFRAKGGTVISGLNQLAADIRLGNQRNGWSPVRPTDWSDPHKIPALLSLVHSEVSEAVEAFRNDDRTNFDEELADVLIRILDLAHGMGIDIETTVQLKLDRNRHRGHRHGGKRL
jgi:NTP pyrophosphatase (non-canonical NTP hydrolase)